MLVPTEETVVYQSKLKLIDLAYEISQSKRTSKPDIKKKIAQGTNIFLWLQALEATTLSVAQREKLYLCLVDIADIRDYAVAPVLGQTLPPTILIGQGNTIINNITNQTSTVFQNADVDTGTEVGDAFSIAVARGAVWFYTVRQSPNQRSGMLEASWLADGSLITTQHDSTDDLGDTSDVVLSVDFNSGNIRLLATAASDNWILEGIRLLIYPI